MIKEKNSLLHHKLFWGSSYDRGLDNLLFMWPDIKSKFPDAELHICYGWNLFDKAAKENPERQQWKKSVEMMMNQEGIIHHGRVGQKKLAEIRSQCGIWAYPTYFTEINCITALECQNDGVVPVTMELAALSETVGSGIKIKGDITDEKVQREYLSSLLDLMGDLPKWQKESNKAREFAKNYDWSVISAQWDKIFKEKSPEPLVSVITLSIRTGWWNIMADNLSKQTYKNFEWVIVDDYKEDRSEIAKKYAERYGLSIRYLRGDKVLRLYPRRYGLVRANNKAWKEAKGELLVYLQDFILIPENGIESLVDINRHNPNALIAPVDQYWHCKPANKENKEDWWDGDTDIITKFSWRNVRMAFAGIRKSENPFDFEMNYCAIPRKIIEKLNGWWEFFDDGLGFDNTEIAHRAMLLGCELIIDDTNEAKCINLWPLIGGTEENISQRERYLAIPYWIWLTENMEDGKISVIRDEKLDKKLKFEFEVPKEVKNEDCSDWIKNHTQEIVKEWNEGRYSYKSI